MKKNIKYKVRYGNSECYSHVHAALNNKNSWNLKMSLKCQEGDMMDVSWFQACGLLIQDGGLAKFAFLLLLLGRPER